MFLYSGNKEKRHTESGPILGANCCKSGTHGGGHPAGQAPRAGNRERLNVKLTESKNWYNIPVHDR